MQFYEVHMKAPNVLEPILMGRWTEDMATPMHHYVDTVRETYGLDFEDTDDEDKWSNEAGDRYVVITEVELP